MITPEKRTLDEPEVRSESKKPNNSTHVKGVAAIKAEYLVPTSSLTVVEYDDDEAEGGDRDREGESKPRNKKKQKGQNHKRDLKQKKDIIKLCPSLIDPEDDRICQVGADKCRFHHDIASYLESKPQDIDGI